MSLHELKMSPYYYRWAMVDANDTVVKVSVEKKFLTGDFRKYLEKAGFHEVPREEDYQTIWFECGG